MPTSSGMSALPAIVMREWLYGVDCKGEGSMKPSIKTVISKLSDRLSTTAACCKSLDECRHLVSGRTVAATELQCAQRRWFFVRIPHTRIDVARAASLQRTNSAFDA